MALPELKSGDLEIKIVDEGTYNCTITDKTGKIIVIKINNKKFNLRSNYGSDFSFTEESTSKQRIFHVDENFFNSIHEKPPETIEICMIDRVFYHIYVKVITNDSTMIQIINDNVKVREILSMVYGSLKNTKEREPVESSKYYPANSTQQELSYTPEETPKIEVPNNSSENKKLKIDNYKLQQEVKSLKELLEKVSESKFRQNELEKSLKAEIQKLESEKRNIDYERSSIKRKYEEINKKYEEIENVSKAKDEQFYNLKSDLSKFEAENTQLSNELEMKKDELNKAKSDNISVNSTNRMNDIILKQINDNVNRLISYQFANTGDGTLHITKLNEVIRELLNTINTLVSEINEVKNSIRR